MDAILRQVLNLQKEWSHENTPQMKQRGQLVRNQLPSLLKPHSNKLAGEMGIESSELLIQGSDGVGQKSEIPWVRLGSRTRSPSATIGWYLVYLFAADGEAVYLALAHGSTEWVGSETRPRPPEELSALALWAREILRADILEYEDDLQLSIELNSRRSRLGEAYSLSTAVAKLYTVNDLPGPGALLEDLFLFSRLLRKVYLCSDLHPQPSSIDSSIGEIAELSEIAAGRSRARPSGQGFRVSQRQRAELEQYAMLAAKALLEKLGWTVRDVSRTYPYDYEARRDNQVMQVEVKGTTSMGAAVLLTQGEVDLHQLETTNSCLIIVSEVRLPDAEQGLPTGGKIRVIYPWNIHPDDLKPISHQYQVPRASDSSGNSAHIGSQELDFPLEPMDVSRINQAGL